MVTTISKRFRFEASHVLPEHPGKCSQLHGHSWELEVSFSGEVNEYTGFVIDYGTIKSLVKKHILDKLDHQHLGYGNLAKAGGIVEEAQLYKAVLGPTFYPSSENLSRWIFDTLDKAIKSDSNAEWRSVSLERVTLKETESSSCIVED